MDSSSNALLSFYGLELQSHAAIIIGLGIIIFTIVQGWGALPFATKASRFYGYWFSVLAGFVGVGVVYQLWRVYAFGKLASGVLYCSKKSWNDTIKDWNDPLAANEKWEDLSELTRVTLHSERMLRENSEPLIRLQILRTPKHANRLRLRFRVLIGSFVIAFFVSYVLIFAEFDGGLSILFAILSGGVVSGGYLSRKRVYTRIVKLLKSYHRFLPSC